MLADVLIPRGAHDVPQRAPLFTYRIPDELLPRIAVGQLVAVPFGERAVAGIVWALVADPPAAAAPREDAYRTINSLLLPEPVLLPPQRALAEWISDYYAAPLGAAVRLFLPPGLAREVRVFLRPVESADSPAPKNTSHLPGDEAIVLARIRERGRLAREQVVEALGPLRARTAIRTLLKRGQITLAAEIPVAFLRARSERRVRLCAQPDALEDWRADARAALDTRVASRVAVPVTRTRRAKRVSQSGEAEWLLRQLAVLDVLTQAPRGADAEEMGSAWRLEELRRLTRATPAALAELEAAGLIAIEEARTRFDPLAGRTITRTEPLPLTGAQHAAVEAITAALEDTDRGPAAFLLHGITGSGKTEVYLQALAAALARGRRGIVLVPEIALTPQAMARYAGRFPGRIALLHSGLTDAERLDEWRRIRAGEVDFVLGSRSALFAPVERLGLIVVDEEHEGAYKQDRTPTYSARDGAVRLGQLAEATVVLGSATPSVESFWLAARGDYTLLELRERPSLPPQPPSPGGEGGEKLRRMPAQDAGEDERDAITYEQRGLPPVTLVDLRAELRAGNTSILSEPLRLALVETLERGEQAILFLNRRGTASSVVCRECGYVVRCGNCDISLTFHAGEHALICHYCGERHPAPTLCPICRSDAIRYFGLGTERVESAVKRLFPGARVLRWDRDTARTRAHHEELLRAFTERRADILVGTQMIAKGLDLPAVTLVGVVSADVALFLPDFRASERAFQLLTQVAGRAGRGERPGRVLVQTFNPEHFCIQAAAHHDYAAFITAELEARTRFGYPPLRRFVRFSYAHADRYTAQVEATALAARVERLLAEVAPAETDLVGPAPAFMERLRGRYWWHLVLRSPDPRPLLSALLAEGLPRGWAIDVDPASTL